MSGVSGVRGRSGREGLSVRHLRVGWWGLALFALLGAGLEVLHAIKTPAYLDGGRETTRLLLRLAHAHGTGLSIVNILYGLTARAMPRTSSLIASASLITALVLLPLGFFAGGLGAFRGDPGLGILLVPAGAVALISGLATVAKRIGGAERDEDG